MKKRKKCVKAVTSPLQRETTPPDLQTRKRKIFPLLLYTIGSVFLLLVAGLSYIWFTASGQIVGQNPLPVTLAENNSSAYISWKRAGIRDRILVHIDSHIDLEWIPDPLLEKIIQASTPAVLQAVERDPYDIRHIQEKPLTIKNFIYPALREGMFKAVYWVTPEADLSSLVVEYKKLIRESVGRITLEDLDTFRWRDNRIEITLFGTPFIITRLEDLPEFQEPVILDIDTDYFDPPYLGHRLEIPSLWPEEFVEILRAKKIRADLVDICYSVREGYLSLEYKYLADYVATLIREPQQDTPLLQAFRYRKEGDILRHQGKYTKAMQAYQQALALTPESAGLYYGMSLISAALGDTAEEERLYHKAVTLDPDYQHAQLYLGDSYFNKKLFREAIPPYQRYLSQYPDHLTALFKLAYSLTATGQISLAIETYRRVLTLFPALSSAHYNLGLLLSRQGAPEEAAAAYREALHYDPFFFYAYHELGNIAFRQGNNSLAMQYYQQALALNPTHAESYYQIGLLSARQGLTEEAIKALSTVVAIDPGYVQAYYNLGVAYTQRGAFEQAMTAYKRALQLEPSLAAAHNNLGSLYLRQQQPEKAIEEYEAALSSDPSLTMVHFSLGMLYAEVGRREEAIQRLQNFLEQWQGEPHYLDIARRALEELENGRKK